MFNAVDVMDAILSKLGNRRIMERNDIKHPFPWGASAFFVYPDDEWGWKGFYADHHNNDEDGYYRQSADRDYNYDVASYAAACGVGAPVGEKCDITIKGMEIRGYFQKIARDFSVADGDENYYRACDRLRAEMMSYGLNTNDVGYSNVGIYNGKLVARDVSHDDSDAELIRERLYATA
jgi:hypothetical protein